MNEVNNNLFAKIPTGLFYIGKEKDNSILSKIKDDKVVLILYYLYLSTNYIQESNVSISYLINKCNYYSNDKIKKEFKYILNDLIKLKYIDTKDNMANITHNDLITLDISNLLNLDTFVMLEQKELNTLLLSSTNKKELLNLLKVYLYLKCRCWKKKDGGKTYIEGGKAQVTYCSYKNISEYTYTSEGHIIEYITKLQDLKMIKYVNLGKKYHINDQSKRTTDCNNLYTITSIVQGDYIDLELKEGLKQQQYSYEENGYVIVKTKNISDKIIYGRKGYLTKKLNNETITEQELKELELINTDIEKYKIEYKPKKKEKKKKEK